MFRTKTASTIVVVLGLVTAALTCAAGAHAAVSGVDGSGDQSALNGVYRVSWSEKQLIAAGTSREYAHNNHGTVTLTLHDGRFRFQIKEEPTFRCTGGYDLYTLNGTNRFSFSLYNAKTCPDGNGIIAAIWSRSGPYLRFKIVSNRGEPGDEVNFGGKPWRKIG